MTYQGLIAKIREIRPDIEPRLMDMAASGEKNAMRQVADQVCAGTVGTLTISEVYEISRWGINDDLSVCPDHPCRK